MEPRYFPETHCSSARWPTRDYDERGSFPAPACHFGRFAVAGHRPESWAVEGSRLASDQGYYGWAFRPPGCLSFRIVPPADAQPEGDVAYYRDGASSFDNKQLVHPHMVTHTNMTTSQLSSDKPVPAETEVARSRRGPVKKRTGRRLILNAEMRKALEASFQNDNYVSEDERQRLTRSLPISEQQIKTWFQNRRAKHRKAMLAERLCSPTDDRVNTGLRTVCAGTHGVALVSQPSGEHTHPVNNHPTR